MGTQEFLLTLQQAKEKNIRTFKQKKGKEKKKKSKEPKKNFKITKLVTFIRPPVRRHNLPQVYTSLNINY
jgi:hypothetical protein